MATTTSLTALFERTIDAHRRFAAGNADALAAVGEAMAATLTRGGKILVFGNGGSAAEAQHLAAELVGRFVSERAGLAAVALTVDSSVLTSVSNDYGFERVFARQIEALGRPGDLAFGITTSGRSANVVAALDTAKQRGLRTVALTGGDGGPAGAAADWHLNVAEASTPRVQEVHLTILHALCEMIDARFGVQAGTEAAAKHA